MDQELFPGHAVSAAALADALGKEQVAAYVAACEYFRLRRHCDMVAEIDVFLQDPYCDADLRDAGMVRLESLEKQWKVRWILGPYDGLEFLRLVVGHVASIYHGRGMSVRENIVCWPDSRPLCTIAQHVELYRQVQKRRMKADDEMKLIGLAGEQASGVAK